MKNRRGYRGLKRLTTSKVMESESSLLVKCLQLDWNPPVWGLHKHQQPQTNYSEYSLNTNLSSAETPPVEKTTSIIRTTEIATEKSSRL